MVDYRSIYQLGLEKREQELTLHSDPNSCLVYGVSIVYDVGYGSSPSGHKDLGRDLIISSMLHGS
jgi:hypothetical protein